MVSAEDVIAMDAILAHMEALVQTQQVTIAALTIVIQQQQSAAVGGKIRESRGFATLNKFDGAKDAWRTGHVCS